MLFERHALIIMPGISEADRSPTMYTVVSTALSQCYRLEISAYECPKTLVHNQGAS